MRQLLLIVCGLIPAAAAGGGITEFCLDGRFDLGARFQGLSPDAGERYPTRWCVITDDDGARTRFNGRGRANPDMDGEFSVLYLPPDTVRILTDPGQPDIEFQGTDNLDDALRVRWLDPRRLVDDWRDSPNRLPGIQLELAGAPGEERLERLSATAALPLRGVVDVVWQWNWMDADRPQATLTVDGDLFFVATGTWRPIEDANAWGGDADPDPVVLPGERWPASIDMSLESLAEDVYLVKNVRSGFQHMIVDTEKGLVVADAPAGWVEFHQVPPADLVPGLGVSGLSERLVDFLRTQLPGRPVLAVALTHAHDDHAGGARAFAAAGSDIYAPRRDALFLATALNRDTMPEDRLSRTGRRAAVSPVGDVVELGSPANRVRIVAMGPGPHAASMLGVWAVDAGFLFVSDVHVPRSDAAAPPAERAATECWFARWATERLPDDVVVINSHSAVRTPVSRLQRYLESSLCRPAAAENTG